MNRRAFGRKGELIAMNYLARRGYRILATNYYCRFGELDIVAQKGETLVFVEVKCRRSIDGFEQAVGPKKVEALMNSARSFLQWTGLEEATFRFMLVYVHLQHEAAKTARIRCLKDPF